MTTIPSDDLVLPVLLRTAHRMAKLFYEQLQLIIDLCYDLELLDVSLELDTEAQQHFDRIHEDENAWDWLVEHGYRDAIYKLGYRRLFVAVLSDLCEFVSEGLRCSEWGKLTVAFALFRKPFKDNLFLLEWLLADATDLLERFHNSNAEAYAVDRVPPDRKREIIRIATHASDAGLDTSAEFLFEVRYVKTIPYSLERFWNQATHLVTTFSGYKTQRLQLNFVFSNETNEDWLWECVYIAIPTLLYHAVEVGEAIMERIIASEPKVTIDQKSLNLNRLRRRIAFIYLATRSRRSDVDLPLSQVTDTAMFTCGECGSKIDLDLENLKSLSLELTITCQTCKSKIPLNEDKE